eukprot:Seg3619.1 transcript_id=Seg3619.1/GoldUCD/mRNA.D3Y31 product="Ubiquitin-like-specific protease 1" protein_id=Seg3619.1/GoldUCD/D3Y31
MTYISTHNPPCAVKDTEHHPNVPSSSVMDAVKSKLLFGASVDNIHKDLREGADIRENRDCNQKIEKKHAVTKRNLREIARKLKVNRRMHPDDATSLFHIVKKLTNEKYDPILLYKPQGEDVIVGPDDMHGTPAESQSFLLGIQTKEQLEMFQKHASKIVCLDSTHCTNKYDFKLVMLVVPDELNKGYPVAHLISNHEDEAKLHYFFEAIKKRCSSDIKINAVMTDDDNTGWSAFSSVFGNEAHHLLCKWHVHRSWRRKLHSLLPKEREFQNEIYQAIVVLLEERDSTKFKAMALAFVSTYMAVSEQFVRYFQEVYLTRPEKWAMCHRNFPHANTDTNMFVESFHNRLKTYYMQRRRGRRLDDLVNLLLTIEEDDFWRHRLDIMYGKDERARTTKNRHKSGLRIEDDDILQLAPSIWEVRSHRKSDVRLGAKNENEMSDVDESDDECSIKPEMTGEPEAKSDQDGNLESSNDHEPSFPVYRVELKRDQCCRDDFCFTRCLQLSCLGLCGHLYQCSCPDISPMCKHIHKVHSVRLRNNEARRIHQLGDNDVDCTQDALPVYNTEIHEIKREERSEEKFKERSIAALNCIENYLENENIRSYGIGIGICVVLEQLALECSSIAKVESVAQGHLDTPVTVPPNEKLKIQFRPKKMVRTSKKRSASTTLSGPSPKKSKIIKKMLLGDTHSASKKEGNDENCNPRKSTTMPCSNTEAKAITKSHSKEMSDLHDKFSASQKDQKQEKAAKSPSLTMPLQGKEKLQTTKKGKSYNAAPKQINQVAITESTTSKSLTRTILKNGPNNLSVLVLKSLETELSAFEIKKLAAADRSFRPRWLYDEIIDSFCWMIAKEVPGVLLCPTLVTAALGRRRQNALQLDHLWKEDSVEDARVILAPWNPSASHWILIAIFLPSLKALYLDPLSNSRSATDKSVVRAKVMFSYLIRVKKSDDAELQWSFPTHALQEDGYNCGVFTCVYAERIAKNQSINSEVNTFRERQRIYAKITGSCLKHAQNGKSHINKRKCRECEEDGGVNWVECSRCKQWHHCDCVGLSLQEADNLPEFYCPC